MLFIVSFCKQPAGAATHVLEKRRYPIESLKIAATEFLRTVFSDGNNITVLGFDARLNPIYRLVQKKGTFFAKH